MLDDTRIRLRRLMILIFLVAGLVWFSKDPTRALLMTRKATDRQQSVRVIITPQDGTPLRIISTSVASSTPKNFRLLAQIQNQSLKAIRAYAINSQFATTKQQNGSSEFMNLTQRSSIWQPTEIKTVEFGDSQQDQITGVRLTVDFVEFVDGTEWGPDSQNSRDLLAGQRHGARLERQRLRELMETKGQDALARDIQMNDEDKRATAVADSHSVQWQEGFRHGVVSVRRRLRQVIASGNEERIKAELTKPFDTSEEDRK